MIVQHNINLKPFNTFGIDAQAAAFLSINTITDAQELVQSQAFITEPHYILGGGSNILFTGDFNGLIVKVDIGGIELVKESSEYVWLKAGAGVNWHELVLYGVNNGWGGIENLSLIPGTVGAAPMQNIGAYGVEIKEVFENLTAVELATGKKVSFRNEDCNFGYRESVFKKELKEKFFIADVTLRLSKHPVVNTSYGAIQSTLKARNIDHPTIKDVSDAVIDIRRSKLPDPTDIGNAGSFFKNPVISSELFSELINTYPQVPHYPQTDGRIKVPAGWLIEQCGWKGYRRGSIGVHDKQALVLVNLNGGKGLAIKELSEEIQESVKREFDIELVREVNLV